MKYLFLLLTSGLVGCLSTQEPVKSIIIDNPEKDVYINKLESEIKEAGAVLTIINESQEITNPAVKELTKAEIQRLMAYCKPDSQRVDVLRKTVAQNDIQTIKAEETKTAQLVKDVETTRALLSEKEKQIAIAKADADIQKANALEADAKASRAFKDKVLWMLSCVGAGLAVTGLAVAVFTPFKTKGLYLCAGGAVFTASAWILDSKWMEYAIAATIIVSCLDLLYILVEKTIVYLQSKSRSKTL